MLVRLPSNEDYAPQILKKFQWLPKLSKHLSYQITTPVALGHPSVEYPWHWSINGWIDGETAVLDQNTWIRALGWTFWKALCWPVKGMDVQRIIHDVYQDYQMMKLV